MNVLSENSLIWLRIKWQPKFTRTIWHLAPKLGVSAPLKVLINPNTILLIWILCNANRWMSKYFLIWTFICCYIEVRISKMVMRWRLCRHNLHTQEKYYLIHMFWHTWIVYSIFYLFFLTQIFKRFIIWKGIKKQKCLHWRHPHYHFGNTNLNMTLNKSSNQKIFWHSTIHVAKNPYQ